MSTLFQNVVIIYTIVSSNTNISMPIKTVYGHEISTLGIQMFTKRFT